MAAATPSVRSRTPTYLDNPPNARRTMEALREMGYDSYASILDLIDNSVDAHAKLVQVSIGERIGDIVIEIRDDGCGMDEPGLSEALRLGSDTERLSGDLGKFGMGLVTASIGLSMRLEVLSREADGDLLFGGFDLEDIYKENKFLKWIEPASGESLDGFGMGNGTVVRLLKTDRISNRNVSTFANTLKKRIGQVFRKFLKAGGVVIHVNGKPVEPIDPLMLSHPKTKLLLDTEISVDDENTATLRVVDLPDLGIAGNIAHGIIPQNTGFYILRNNREIIEAATFDFYKKHPDFSHFRAEVSFHGSVDSAFHTDVKKATIQPSQAFLDRLRTASQALITESARSGRKRANTGRGQIDHSAAESNITKRASLIPKPLMQIEQRKPRGKSGVHSSRDGTRDRTPHVTHFKTTSGLKVTFEEGDYGPENTFYLVRQEKGIIVVTYNREHPFWRELVEHATDSKVVAILDYLVFAMANSELLLGEGASVFKSNVNSTLVGLLV